MNSLTRKYYHRDLEQSRERGRKNYLKYKEKITTRNSKWKLNNRGKANASAAKRRAKKHNATPAWLTEECLLKIDKIYILARKLTKKTGTKYHVDHIIPLQGKTVCGLHVPTNLQILTQQENCSKSNKLGGALLHSPQYLA